MVSVPAKPQANWRLKKTLARAVDFRPIEAADVRYLFAAYKLGNLAAMGGAFAVTNMVADEFKREFEAEVVAKYDGAWTMFAHSKKGFIPVGVLFGIWAPQSPYMIIAGVAWFAWASKRNIIESIVNFLNGIRKQFQMMGYAADEHKAVYEVCCRHGVMRRVGTSMIVFPGKSAAVFETRAPEQ